MKLLGVALVGVSVRPPNTWAGSVPNLTVKFRYALPARELEVAIICVQPVPTAEDAIVVLFMMLAPPTAAAHVCCASASSAAAVVDGGGRIAARAGVGATAARGFATRVV